MRETITYLILTSSGFLAGLITMGVVHAWRPPTPGEVKRLIRCAELSGFDEDSVLAAAHSINMERAAKAEAKEADRFRQRNRTGPKLNGSPTSASTTTDSVRRRTPAGAS